ncbi:hypothetical protein [Rhodococcus pyridinivorans]|uniref:hypothetical protein n=1 Tax=Rhodococcus pyridinivorans TaxID=103816 RepID=UPI000BA1EA7C|nr:hypothetical protein [Rhodococcus pyridinivorans]
MTTGGGAPAFATYRDVQDAWRPLRDAERTWAVQLLEAAARWIRRQLPNIADDDPAAKLVSISVVKSALTAGDASGYVSHSKSIGPWSKSGTLANPDGALVFTDWHKEQLGLGPTRVPHYRFGVWDE